jgi:putative membrane protein
MLTAEDKQEIAKAIRRAELHTSGEIVFAVTDASGRYRHATLQGAFAGSVLATAIYLALPIEHTIALLLWAEIIAFGCFYSLMSYFPWRRWFIRSHEMEECVHDAAFREFYGSGLYRTRESNGVLIYLSNLERRVVVLGDKGIHERMGEQHWHEVRDTIIRGIREGRTKDGICAAITSCGDALAKYFPRPGDDTNELPDDVIDRTKR